MVNAGKLSDVIRAKVATVNGPAIVARFGIDNVFNATFEENARPPTNINSGKLAVVIAGILVPKVRRPAQLVSDGNDKLGKSKLLNDKSPVVANIGRSRMDVIDEDPLIVKLPVAVSADSDIVGIPVSVKLKAEHVARESRFSEYKVAIFNVMFAQVVILGNASVVRLGIELTDTSPDTVKAKLRLVAAKLLIARPLTAVRSGKDIAVVRVEEPASVKVPVSEDNAGKDIVAKVPTDIDKFPVHVASDARLSAVIPVDDALKPAHVAKLGIEMVRIEVDCSENAPHEVRLGSESVVNAFIEANCMAPAVVSAGKLIAVAAAPVSVNVPTVVNAGNAKVVSAELLNASDDEVVNELKLTAVATVVIEIELCVNNGALILRSADALFIASVFAVSRAGKLKVVSVLMVASEISPAVASDVRLIVASGALVIDIAVPTVVVKFGHEKVVNAGHCVNTKA